MENISKKIEIAKTTKISMLENILAKTKNSLQGFK